MRALHLGFIPKPKNWHFYYSLRRFIAFSLIFFRLLRSKAPVWTCVLLTHSFSQLVREAVIIRLKKSVYGHKVRGGKALVAGPSKRPFLRLPLLHQSVTYSLLYTFWFQSVELKCRVLISENCFVLYYSLSLHFTVCPSLCRYVYLFAHLFPYLSIISLLWTVFLSSSKYKPGIELRNRKNKLCADVPDVFFLYIIKR